MTKAEPRSVVAGAKVNLALEVLGSRDDGYHELLTIVQTVEFGDVVRVVPREAGDDRLDITGPSAGGTPRGAENLALRALRALRERACRVPAVDVTIEKHVPPAGGLGGGAADAAAVLRLAGELFAVPTDRLRDAAAAVGSDEPALLPGGTVLATGRGERVRQLPDLVPHDVVLFPMGTGRTGKTGAAFAMLAHEDGWDDGSRTRELAERLSAGGTVSTGDVVNSFGRVAPRLYPETQAAADAVARRTGERPALAGAGPSLFWIGEAGRGARIAEAAADTGLVAIATRTSGAVWRHS